MFCWRAGGRQKGRVHFAEPVLRLEKVAGEMALRCWWLLCGAVCMDWVSPLRSDRSSKKSAWRGFSHSSRNNF